MFHSPRNLKCFFTKFLAVEDSLFLIQNFLNFPGEEKRNCLDMLGKFQYGSELLNVTYDPTRSYEAASFAFDDDGLESKKEYIIEKGILMRAQGGIVSQARAGVDGCATARACSWNRPTMDRMSNLNVEPGSSSFDDMVASVEKGIYMKSCACNRFLSQNEIIVKA